MKTYYAWFSQKQFNMVGGIIYRKPSGEEVLVTQVTESESHGTGFDDIQSLGIVTRYVRKNGHSS